MIDSYSLDLDVDFKRAVIRGSVTIHAVGVKAPFELNAKEMTVRSVSADGGKDVPFKHDAKNGLLRLTRLPKSKEVDIVISYEKRVPDEASTGVYKARYGTDYFLTTDFEPDRARTFFPCKDEPTWKSVFNLSVVTDAGLKVISNASLKKTSEVKGGKKTRFVFEPTPRMSTYLFYMGVGRFSEASRAPRSKQGPEVIVASRTGTSGKCEFILELASSVVDESGKYFGVKYPLKKLHLVAIPEMGGAMENWGAITSFEGGLLVDDSASELDRRGAALVTAHEIQHQWFGDLVTMKWWDDIWLNESFATFMSYKIVDRLHPEWDCWSDFLGTAVFRSMGMDELHATHPIQARVRTPSEINEIFDQISYGKGASVLRMVESFLGEEAFRAGIKDYIKRFSYSNAISDDLWKSLEKASGQPVYGIMSAWGRRSGFPLVTVSKEKGKLVFRQRRFRLTGKEESSDKEPWPIPVRIRLNGRESRFILDERTKELEIEGGRLSQLKVNSGQTGYYCVEYDGPTYELLASQFPTMGGLDRAGVVNDLFQLLKAGRPVSETYFRFVGMCAEARDYTTVLTVLLQIQVLLAVAEGSGKVQDAARGFLTKQMSRLSLAPRRGEPTTDGILRGRVALMLVQADDAFARTLAEKFEGYQSVDPELRAAVAAAYVKTGGARAFAKLMDMLPTAAEEVDREKLYAGLASTKDPSLIKEMIEFTASGKVSRTDIIFSLSFPARNPALRNALWAWTKENFDRLWDLCGSPLFVLSLLQGVIPYVAVENEADAVRFLSGDRLKKGEKSFRQDLELLSVYSGLRKRL